MSEYYRINELAKLYGLCADTLRYYEEQGILSPARGGNNYRMYSIQDIGTLNIVQHLRSLDMPLARIREYTESRTVAATRALLEEEAALIDRRIADLEKLRAGVRRRAGDIQRALALPLDECRLLELPPRPCYLLSEGVTLEEDVDFLLKKLEAKHNDRLRSFGEWQMGATLDERELEKGHYNRFANAFFIGGDGMEDYDHILPEGQYASILYCGSYENLAHALPKLFSYIAGQGLRPCNAPIELYHIDIHDTCQRREYLTEVQVKVLPAGYSDRT